MHFVSNLYCDPSLFERARQIPLTQWSPIWRARFHGLKAEMLLAVECSAIGVTLKKSSIQHPNAGRGVFAARPIGKGTVVGYYYGSLVYEDLSAAGSRLKTYGENIMKVTKATFSKWANRLPETATDRNMVEHPVWIVPAPFCAMHFVKDGRYLSGDEAPEAEKLGKERKNNVEFYQTESPSSATSFRSYKILAVRALRNVRYGEELFVDYGNNYDFEQ